MKQTGIFRRIDSLGRFVLPMEIRKNLDIKENDYLEVMVQEGKIILKKVQVSCVLCGSNEDLLMHYDKNVCRKCVKVLAEM